eukprot:TRINITY_DN8780_c0_g1_i1.p1 TRINITY_DN8780_c0_g1~~TRINITY_DN8780_c0_g1_i1.p1  ORF type:complete len:130 (+),score=12.31 TRINITY_DN8780_c0_g1_i1:155-544(+)
MLLMTMVKLPFTQVHQVLLANLPVDKTVPTFFELHPADIEHLQEYSQRWNKSHVKQSDGYQGVLGLVPPPNRRGVVLIDPPYELKEDYIKAVRTIVNAYKKFATGTYILWYPVVKRELVEQMQNAFTKK